MIRPEAMSDPRKANRASSEGQSVPVTFCLFEDRPECEIGIRLLVVTLKRHCSGTRTILFHPNPSDALARWLGGFPDIELRRQRLPGAGSADIKPHALMAALALGHRNVVWLDTDMMLAGDPRPFFEHLPEDVLGVAEEVRSAPNQGSRLRTEAWGMTVGRVFLHTLNTCITRVTDHHVPLLVEWARLLVDERYTRYFDRQISLRPPHAMFDLDILNALLGSSEWAHQPVHVFRTGNVLIHCGGARSFSLGERLGGLFKPCPPILHALAKKPWDLLSPEKRYTGRYWEFRKLMQEISPFVALARQYREEVGIPCPWLDQHSTSGRLLTYAGLGHFALRGLPVALVGEAARLCGRAAPGL